MSRQTKQEFIEELQRNIGGHFSEKEALKAAIEDSVRAFDRLAVTLKAEKDKVSKLKGVAHFYRAQRDRIDAYLSAVLDMADRQRDDNKSRYDEQRATESVDMLQDIVGRAENQLRRASQVRPDRRPRVQEPMSPDPRGEGRDYTQYRDQEPADDWENF